MIVNGHLTMNYYEPTEILDAPEHYEYSRALGILDWGTWDHEVRPFKERVCEFVHTFPPQDPLVNAPSASLVHQRNKTLPSDEGSSQLDRFLAKNWRCGSLHELLSRYGLKMSNQPRFERYSFKPAPLRETALRRNMKLRSLHEGVDVEASDMNAAKTAYLEKQESQKAAREVRSALKKMNEDLRSDGERKG